MQTNGKSVNISIDIDNNIWTRGDYQHFVKEILQKNNSVNLYLISKEPDLVYQKQVAKSLGIVAPYYIQCVDLPTVEAAIIANNIQISFVSLVSDATDITANTNSKGIFVNVRVNNYTEKMVYLEDFDEILTELFGLDRGPLIAP